MYNHSVMHPAIKLRHIRAFIDIVSEGGLSAVARRQGITQPALSRTLTELETLLEQVLFLRQGRKLVLTEQGALFHRYAVQALQVLEAGAAALHPGTSGMIRVGVLPTVATQFFPQVVLALHKVLPEVVLAVETGPHHYLVRLLREGNIDLMIGRLPSPGEMAGLSFDYLYEDDIILVARGNHPGAGHPVTRILRGARLILPPVTALIRTPVDAYLTSLGMANVRPFVETVSLALGRGICLASDSLWFISRGVVLSEIEQGILTEFPTGARFLSGAVGMTCRQSTTTAGLTTLQQLARDIAGRLRE